MNANERESEGHEQESEGMDAHSRPFPTEAQLFDRVVTILEQARGNVVRAVNTNMVLAYWLIGREIVEEVQGGKDRAEYGEKMVENLSARLTERYGNGFPSRIFDISSSSILHARITEFSTHRVEN